MTADLLDALTELHGVTITVRHELKPASQRLMDTLGVRVVIDPRAEPCEQFTLRTSRDPRPDRVAERMCEECARLEGEA